MFVKIKKEFHVIQLYNMKNIFIYLIFSHTQINETLFLNDMHKYSCLIHKNHIFYNYMNLVKI
jgi:hypothetical protein